MHMHSCMYELVNCMWRLSLWLMHTCVR